MQAQCVGFLSVYIWLSSWIWRSCKGGQGCLGKVTGGEWKQEARVLLDGGNPRGNYSQVLKNFLIKSHGDILFTEKRSLSKYKRRINVHLWTSFNLKHKQVLFDAKLTLCVYLHTHTYTSHTYVYITHKCSYDSKFGHLISLQNGRFPL